MELDKHQNEKKIQTQQDSLNNGEYRAYKCRYCLLPFHIKEYRRRHESISHKFPCKSCPLHFTQQLLCEKHEKDCAGSAPPGPGHRPEPIIHAERTKPTSTSGRQNPNETLNSATVNKATTTNTSSCATSIVSKPQAQWKEKQSQLQSEVVKPPYPPFNSSKVKEIEIESAADVNKATTTTTNKVPTTVEICREDDSHTSGPEYHRDHHVAKEYCGNKDSEMCSSKIMDEDNDHDLSASLYNSDSDNENDPLGLAQVVYTEPEQDTDSETESGTGTGTTGSGNSSDSENFQIFKCDYCDNHYLNTKDLQHHIEVIHNTKTQIEMVEGQAHYTCHHCPLTFTQNWTRLCHMQSRHNHCETNTHNEITAVPQNQFSRALPSVLGPGQGPATSKSNPPQQLQTKTTAASAYPVCMATATATSSDTINNESAESSPASGFHNKIKYNLRKSALKKYSHTKSPKPLISSSISMDMTETTELIQSSPAPSPALVPLCASTPSVSNTQSRCASPASVGTPRKKTNTEVESVSPIRKENDENCSDFGPIPPVSAPLPPASVPVRNENYKYNCSYCGKEVSSRQYLQVHERIHTGIKPFKCPYKNCRKAFIRKQSMVNHVRVHTGEKPYGCSVCGRYFRVITNLYQHAETHGEIDAALKPFRRISPSNPNPNPILSSVNKDISNISSNNHNKENETPPVPTPEPEPEPELENTTISNGIVNPSKVMPTSTFTASASDAHSFKFNPPSPYCCKIEPEETAVPDEDQDQQMVTESECEVETASNSKVPPFKTWTVKIEPEYYKTSTTITTTHNEIPNKPSPFQESQSSVKKCQLKVQQQPVNIIRSSNYVPLPSTIRQVLDIHVVQYICNICEENFSYRTDALQHLRSFHNSFNN